MTREPLTLAVAQPPCTARDSGIWAPTGELVDRAGRDPGGLARATIADP